MDTNRTTTSKFTADVHLDDTFDDFDSIFIKIASAANIKDMAKRTACKMRGREGARWPCPEREKCDCGEVKNAETINFHSFRPEPEGLFCEAIFGPQQDWRCHCGRYRRLKHAGTICEACGVEVTHSLVRRGRFGYIQLAAPVAHIWFSRALPSPLAMLCGLSLPQLERVLYDEAFIVIEVTDPACPLEPRDLLTETEYAKYSEKYQGGFRAATCAGAICEILYSLDLKAELDTLKAVLSTTKSKQKRRKLTKQLQQVESFSKSQQCPELMIADVIPVFPAGLRMLVPLGGERFATPDINDLYRRILNKNNRLRKLMQLNSPEVILRNEKQQLQEAVDVLFDNRRAKRRVTGPGNRHLKSLSDILTGKHGIFQQNRDQGKCDDWQTHASRHRL